MIDKTRALELKRALESATDSATKAKILDQIIDMVADDLMPEASELATITEAKIETTQNRYGDYLAILSKCPSGLTRLGMSRALIRGGASESGVKSALKVISN